MKILVATEKPFAPAAVAGIKEVIENAGHSLVLVEKGTKADMIAAPDSSCAATRWIRRSSTPLRNSRSWFVPVPDTTTSTSTKPLHMVSAS